MRLDRKILYGAGVAAFVLVVAVAIMLRGGGGGGSDEVVLVTHDSFVVSDDVKQEFETASGLDAPDPPDRRRG